MIYNSTGQPRDNWTTIRPMTTGYFWRGAADNPNRGKIEHIDWTQVEGMIADRSGEHLVINIEGDGWERPGDDGNEQRLDNWVSLIQRVREMHECGTLGVYRMVPRRAFWEPVKHAEGSDSGGIHKKWRLANNRTYRMAAHVDIIHPSLYWWEGERCTPEAMEVYYKSNITEAQQYEKPVVPYLSPTYAGMDTYPLIPTEIVRTQCELLKAGGVSDIVVFASKASGCPDQHADIYTEYFGD